LGPGEGSLTPEPQRNGSRPDHDTELPASRSPATARKVHRMLRNAFVLVVGWACLAQNSRRDLPVVLSLRSGAVSVSRRRDDLLNIHRDISRLVALYVPSSRLASCLGW
jgi:hypothetical protein